MSQESQFKFSAFHLQKIQICTLLLMFQIVIKMQVLLSSPMKEGPKALLTLSVLFTYIDLYDDMVVQEARLRGQRGAVEQITKSMLCADQLKVRDRATVGHR